MQPITAAGEALAAGLDYPEQVQCDYGSCDQP